MMARKKDPRKRLELIRGSLLKLTAHIGTCLMLMYEIEQLTAEVKNAESPAD